MTYLEFSSTETPTFNNQPKHNYHLKGGPNNVTHLDCMQCSKMYTYYSKKFLSATYCLLAFTISEHNAITMSSSIQASLLRIKDAMHIHELCDNMATYI